MAIIDFYRVEHIHSGLGPYHAAAETIDGGYANEVHPAPLDEGLIGWGIDRKSLFGFASPSQAIRWMDAKVLRNGQSIFDRLHKRRSGQFVVKHYLVDSKALKASRTQAICRKSQLKDAVKTYTIPEFVKRFTGKDLTPCVPSSEVTKSTNAESIATSSTAKSSGLTSTSCEPPTPLRSQVATSGTRISGSSALDSALDALIARQARAARELFESWMQFEPSAVRGMLGSWETPLTWSSDRVAFPPITGSPSAGFSEPWHLIGPSRKSSTPSTCRYSPTFSDRFSTTSVTVASRMEASIEVSDLFASISTSKMS